MLVLAAAISSALSLCAGTALRPSQSHSITTPGRTVCERSGGTCPHEMKRLFCALRQHSSDIHPELKVAELPANGQVNTGMGPSFKENVRYLLFDADDTSGFVGVKCTVQSAMACRPDATPAPSGECGDSSCVPDVRNPVLGSIRLQLGGAMAAFAAGVSGQLPSSAAVVGIGAGSLPSWMLATLPEISVDAVDINEQVLSAATQCFGLTKDDPRFHTHVQDGMQFLKSQTRHYDIVMLDVCPLPKHFRTELTTIRSRMLKHGGVLVANGWKFDKEFQDLQQDVMKTFTRVWLATDTHEGNQILLARLGSSSDLSTAEELRAHQVPEDAITWSTEQPWKQLK